VTPLDPDDARRRILEELSKGEYHRGKGIIAWFLGVLQDWLVSFLDRVGTGDAPAIALLVGVAVVLAVVIVLVFRRTGMLRRSTTLGVAPSLDADPELDAATLRSRARDAATAGHHADAIVLSVRALGRDMDERTLLEVDSSLTALELTTRAAVVFPDVGGPLHAVAAAFDTAAYSDHPVRPKQAEDALRLVEYVAGARPLLTEPAP
jgi:hypothetical protein